jgi:hypothetical protein
MYTDQDSAAHTQHAMAPNWKLKDTRAKMNLKTAVA